METYFSNLKDWNGTKFAMTADSKVDGQVITTINYTSIEFNVPIDEKIFDMPK